MRTPNRTCKTFAIVCFLGVPLKIELCHLPTVMFFADIVELRLTFSARFLPTFAVVTSAAANGRILPPRSTSDRTGIFRSAPTSVPDAPARTEERHAVLTGAWSGWRLR